MSLERRSLILGATAALQHAGYRALSAVPVDQVLWSPHLESVVAFSL